MGFEFIILKFWLWFLVHVDNNGAYKAEGKREKKVELGQFLSSKEKSTM